MEQRFLGPLLSGLLILVLFCAGCGSGGQNSSEGLDRPSVTSFTANPSQITRGEAVAISWAASGAGSVTITPSIGQVTATGSAIVSPKTTTTYTAVANGSGTDGKASTLTVTVSASTSTAGLDSIAHFVIMVQENRSFDNYFGKLNDYRMARGLPPNID